MPSGDLRRRWAGQDTVVELAYIPKAEREPEQWLGTMFEFDQYQRSLRAQASGRAPAPYPYVADVTKMSFMLWGEHCVECADPDCYTTCDLYQRRPDGRCRRFTYGIYKNRRFPSLRGYGAEISFKRWGKLEADGNTHMEDVGAVLRREQTLARVRPLLRAGAAAAFFITGNPGWRNLPPDPRKLARRLHRSRLHSSPHPSSFLLEVYNPSPDPVTLQLVMRVSPAPDEGPEELPPPFLARIQLVPGYSCHRFGCGALLRILDSGRRFKVTLMPAADAAVTLVFLTADFVAEGRAAAPADASADGANRHEQLIKCVVFDLDHTIWDGVLLEGRVSPREGVAGVIEALDRRGILMSIVSKNDFASAWRRLESFDLARYFVHPEINWAPKSESIRRIAARLNIGIDTFAFIDDSPFERAEVAQALPMVSCYDAGDIADLLDQPRFRGSVSADAAARRQYYKESMQREQCLSQWSGNYLGFLRSCEIKLNVRLYETGDFQRVAELVQRTNQLNFSGCRHARADLAGFLADGSLEKYVLTCEDRYGTYGTIGFALVSRRSAEIRIEELMISCRVQGRHIEPAFFAFLVRDVAEAKPLRLWVRCNPTARNRPALQALERMNFKRDPSGDGFSIDLAAQGLTCDVVQVVASTSSGSGASARTAD